MEIEWRARKTGYEEINKIMMMDESISKKLPENCIQTIAKCSIGSAKFLHFMWQSFYHTVHEMWINSEVKDQVEYLIMLQHSSWRDSLVSTVLWNILCYSDWQTPISSTDSLRYRTTLNTALLLHLEIRQFIAGPCKGVWYVTLHLYLPWLSKHKNMKKDREYFM